MNEPVRVHGTLESRTFLDRTPEAERAERLGRLGDTLARTFALRREQLRLERQLWRIYQADCKRLGIEPVKADVSAM